MLAGATISKALNHTCCWIIFSQKNIFPKLVLHASQCVPLAKQYNSKWPLKRQIGLKGVRFSKEAMDPHLQGTSCEHWAGTPSWPSASFFAFRSLHNNPGRQWFFKERIKYFYPKDNENTLQLTIPIYQHLTLHVVSQEMKEMVEFMHLPSTS